MHLFMHSQSRLTALYDPLISKYEMCTEDALLKWNCDPVDSSYVSPVASAGVVATSPLTHPYGIILGAELDACLVGYAASRSTDALILSP